MQEFTQAEPEDGEGEGLGKLESIDQALEGAPPQGALDRLRDKIDRIADGIQ